jgi:hypothetical protein
LYAELVKHKIKNQPTDILSAFDLFAATVMLVTYALKLRQPVSFYLLAVPAPWVQRMDLYRGITLQRGRGDLGVGCRAALAIRITKHRVRAGSITRFP